jgi:hypothetical protein
MNLNTNTKKLTLTKTERGYLAKAKAVLLDLARLSTGDLADAADGAADQIGLVEKGLAAVEVAA